jgi:serine/threonine-protein kinase RsbW
VLVELAIGDGSEQFCFKVKDCGNGFDYENLPDPTAPENLLKENGRGIFLMKNLADEVLFENNGNTVHLIFSK